MNKILLTCITIFLSSFVSAQINDLSQLAEGEMTNFQTLFDRKEKVFGYLAVYDKGKINSKERSFEILIFDNSLNIMLSQKFIASENVTSFGGYFNPFDKLILYPYYDEKTQVVRDQFQLDLKENKLEPYKDDCLIYGDIKPCIVEYTSSGAKEKRDKEIDINKFSLDTDLTQLSNKEFIVTESKYIKKHKKLYEEEFKILKYSADKKLLWQYKNPPPELPNFYCNYYTMHVDTSSILFLKMTFEKSKFRYADFIALSTKTGEVMNTTHSTNYKEDTYYTFLRLMSGNRARYIDGRKKFDNKMIFIGSMVQERNSYIREGDVGFIKLTYDILSGAIDFKFFSYFDLQPTFKDIDKFGETDGFDLSLVAVFPFKNGEDVFIFEKFKYSPNYWSGRLKAINSDLVMVTTSNVFKPTDIEIIKKHQTKDSYSEFLYGQYLNDENDLVFFYYDDMTENNKKKSYYLFINKIKNGLYTRDNIKIVSDHNSIIPKMAKEGYILLREFNKEAKYNQIRLEKINF